jgi:hypothetical protein
MSAGGCLFAFLAIVGAVALLVVGAFVVALTALRWDLDMDPDGFSSDDNDW